ASVPFDNDGTVHASAGTLSLERGGMWTCSVTGVEECALLSFAGIISGFTLQSKASLSGKIELTERCELDVSEGVNVPYTGATFRSEERRVGKECRLPVSGEHIRRSGKQVREGKTAIEKVEMH